MTIINKTFREVIFGVGFLTLIIGASADIEYSDPIVVGAVVLLGAILMLIGSKC
jgi:uncharacterized membrane protein